MKRWTCGRPQTHTATMVSVLLTIVLSAATKPTQAQPVPHSKAAPTGKHVLGFGWSWQHLKSQDLIFSPRIFSGSAFTAGSIYYSKKTRSDLQRFSFAFGKANTRSTDATTYLVQGIPKPTRPSIASLIDLRYGYAKRILPGSRIQFMFGGSLESSFRYMDYHFGPSESDGSIVSYALASWFTATLPIDLRQSLHLETVFPLLSWIARSKISVTDDQRLQASSELWHVTKNGRLELPMNFLRLNARLTYTRKLIGKTNLHVSYEFDFLRYNRPLEINLLENALEIGMSYVL